MKLLNILRDLLEKEAYGSLIEMAMGHGGKVVSGLIGLLTDSNELLKWRTVKALGQVTSQLFSQDPERAKKVIRQLIWNLNEESGGMGWGMAEAFGEILAVVPALQNEYACLLAAYISEEGCFIENEQIQKGVIWGLGRLGSLGEVLRAKVIPFFLKSLKNGDPELQGTAAWAIGEIGLFEALPLLNALQIENRMIKIFDIDILQEKPLQQWIEGAIKKINQRGDFNGRRPMEMQ